MKVYIIYDLNNEVYFNRWDKEGKSVWRSYMSEAKTFNRIEHAEEEIKKLPAGLYKIEIIYKNW